MRFEKCIDAIDTHTFGEPTRTLISGIPRLEGNTISEKRKYFEEHYDWIRTATQWEPRGGDVMSGAIILDPCVRDADIGVFFIDSGGYFPMCGHSTIGVTTAIIETGIIKAVEPYTTVRLDTPAGIVTAKAEVKDNCVKSVTFTNVPCFLYKTQVLNFSEYGEIEVDVTYGGGSFVLVPAEPFKLTLEPCNLSRIYSLSKIVQEKSNTEIGFIHPEKPEINGIQQIHWYSTPIVNSNVNARSANVFLPGIDRSPCGTGTAARACTLFAKGKLGLNEKFTQESMTGGVFSAKVIEPVNIEGLKGGIPMVTGSAHITGFHKFVIDPDDPLTYGFPFS